MTSHRSILSATVALAAALAALAAAGCSAANVGGIDLSAVTPKAKVEAPAKSLFSDNAGFGRAVPADGKAHVRLKMQLNFLPGSLAYPAGPQAYALMTADLDGANAANWTGAYISFNPDASQISAPLTRGFAKADFDGNTGTDTDGGVDSSTRANRVSTDWDNFPPIPPGSYTARAFVVKGGTFAADGTYTATAGATQIWGSRQRTYTLKAGANDIFFLLNANGSFAAEDVTASAGGNDITSNGIIKGDTITLNTGLEVGATAANDQDGINKVEIFGFGTAFTGADESAPGVSLKTFTRGGAAGSNEAAWNTYNWDTSTTATFAPTDGDADGEAGTIRIVAYDANNKVIGTHDIAFTGFAAPSARIILD